MRMYDIIKKKRDGRALSDDEIRFFISAFTAGHIPDYQASALMMALYFRGMNTREMATLTDAMAHSGDTVDLSRFGALSVDKHSTGGIGDKTTLIVAPIAASVGCKVAKMSGRGLGHTGGTVDKLDAVAGYRTTLSPDELMSTVERVGMAVIGQSGNLAPADKKLYALRDVTATVESIPLIASSIMSKKIAAGAHSIVLDVKVGSGAFMKNAADAELLAKTMVNLGHACGRNVTAVLTNMDVPLGRAVGNSLEVAEAVQALLGHGDGDLTEVCLTLAAEMMRMALGCGDNEAMHMAKASLEDGSAYAKFEEWIVAQGGSAAGLRDGTQFAPAGYERKIISHENGYISAMNAEMIGNAARIMGAGRAEVGDVIDSAAGIMIGVKTGDKCIAGETVLATLYTDRPDTIDEAERMYLDAVTFSDDAPATGKMIYKIIRQG